MGKKKKKTPSKEAQKRGGETRPSLWDGDKKKESSKKKKKK